MNGSLLKYKLLFCILFVTICAKGQFSWQLDTLFFDHGDSVFLLKYTTSPDTLFINGDTLVIGVGGSGSYWTLVDNFLYPNNTTDSVVIGGTTGLAPLTLTGHMSFTGEGVIRTPDVVAVPATSIYIYGGEGDPDGGVFLNIDENDGIRGEVFIGLVAEETASDSIVTVDERGALGWTQRLWGSTENYVYQNTLTDSVGIGTASPEGALHVASGNVRLGNSASAIKPKIINDEYTSNYLEFDVNNLNVGADMTIFYNDIWVQDTVRLGTAMKLFMLGTSPDTLCGQNGSGTIYRLIPPR